MIDKSNIEVCLDFKKIDGSEFSDEERDWIFQEMYIHQAIITDLAKKFEWKFGMMVHIGGSIGYAWKSKPNSFLK